MKESCRPRDGPSDELLVGPHATVRHGGEQQLTTAQHRRAKLLHAVAATSAIRIDAAGTRRAPMSIRRREGRDAASVTRALVALVALRLAAVIGARGVARIASESVDARRCAFFLARARQAVAAHAMIRSRALVARAGGHTRLAVAGVRAAHEARRAALRRATIHTRGTARGERAMLTSVLRAGRHVHRIRAIQRRATTGVLHARVAGAITGHRTSSRKASGSHAAVARRRDDDDGRSSRP